MRSAEPRGAVRWRAAAALALLAVLAVGASVAFRRARRWDARPSPYDLPAADVGPPGEGPLRRADWFRKLWRERREEWAKRRESESGAVAFFGDSIVDFWGPGLPASFPGLKVANRGISGDTSRGLLLRVDDVLALRPRAVVLLIGTNDLEDGTPPAAVARNVELLLRAFSASTPQPRVVLCLVFPSSPSVGRPTQAIQQLNALYAEAARRHQNVALLDTFALFADPNGEARADEFPDLLHPNARGYAKWSQALMPVLNAGASSDLPR